jgi:DNA-directed RNA polymerase subunit RPC12/RpoP
MNTATTYRYELDRSSRKSTCPQCGKRRLVRCVDSETKQYLPDHVGRCDRENECGYSFTWKQWLQTQSSGSNQKPFIDTRSPEPPRSVDFLPKEYYSQSVNEKYYPRNNFFLFLTAIFGESVARDLFYRYCIGTSALWKGATTFPQIDQAENLRQIKIMLYDRHTGKRVKEHATICGAFLHNEGLNWKSDNGLNLKQTFFGCHLLAEYPNKPVCLCESEKTAIIASVYLPGFIWLATGGASGCKWTEYATYKVLKGRSVTLFPDHGYFNKKTGRTCFQEWQDRAKRISEALPGTKIRVSDILEKRLASKERQDQDLADLLITKDESTGLALNETGYPVIFDYRISRPIN